MHAPPPTSNNSLLNIQSNVRALNSLVDTRIQALKLKIAKLKSELAELDKITPSYGNLHHLNNLQLGGKIHS